MTVSLGDPPQVVVRSRIRAPRPEGLRIEPVALPCLEREWRDLERRARTRNVFVSWPFLSTWWEHFRRDRKGRVWTVREPGGRLVAIVPLYEERVATRFGPVRVLRNVGYRDVVNPDFLDALCEPGREEAVARALVPVLESSGSWDFAEFSELDPEGSLARMAAVWARDGVVVRSEPRSTCPYIALPESFDAFLSGRNPHFRQQLRRYRRKIEKDFDVVWKRLGHDIDIPAGIEAMARLHQARMESTARGGNFRKSDYFAFQRALAHRLHETGQLFSWIVFIDGAPAATHYGFLTGRCYYGYQMGFDPRYHKYSPGHYMTGRVMEMLIDRGVREMNLLRGTDAWKFRWTDRTRRTITLRLLRPDWQSSLAYVRTQLSQSPALVARFLLGRETFDELRGALARWRGRLASP